MSSDITKLPIEVIDLIFGHLTMANDRRRTAQVCKLFNKVIRSQSIRNRNNTLKLDDPPPMDSHEVSESPFRIFENWESLPFSELYSSNWAQNTVMESEFWSAHGHEISEMILWASNNSNKDVSILSSFFPNLKKLTIDGTWDINPKFQNTLNCTLSIEELCFDSIDSSETILPLLRCCPCLKKLEFNRVDPTLLPKILPWLESVDSSILYLKLYEIPINKLLNLPSKIVFGELTIQVDEKPEMIREFFKRPRVIETLILKRRAYNPEFNQDEEEGENNPRVIFFTRDQVEALRGAKSIKKVKLWEGVLDFGGSLDILAQLPGLESISLDLTWHQPDQLYPLYWSSPETAKKIHKIRHKFGSALDYLDGLSSLKTFSVSSVEYHSDSTDSEVNTNGLSSDDIQHLIRNCPNLKKIKMSEIVANDADLIGTGDLLPFSSLGNLESLNIDSAPNITSEAFKSAFKFPKLLNFHLENSFEEPFNQNDAKFLTENCPNVSVLYFTGFHINEEAFEYLLRNLPYLREICFVSHDPSTRMISKEKVMAMQKEFPYLNLACK